MRFRGDFAFRRDFAEISSRFRGDFAEISHFVEISSRFRRDFAAISRPFRGHLAAIWAQGSIDPKSGIWLDGRRVHGPRRTFPTSHGRHLQDYIFARASVMASLAQVQKLTPPHPLPVARRAPIFARIRAPSHLARAPSRCRGRVRHDASDLPCDFHVRRGPSASALPRKVVF